MICLSHKKVFLQAVTRQMGNCYNRRYNTPPMLGDALRLMAGLGTSQFYHLVRSSWSLLIWENLKIDMVCDVVTNCSSTWMLVYIYKRVHRCSFCKRQLNDVMRCSSTLMPVDAWNWVHYHCCSFCTRKLWMLLWVAQVHWPSVCL